MSALIDRMQALADRLTTGGVKAYIDPAEAHAARPCILVPPPVLDYLEGTLDGAPIAEWRLIALSSYEAGTLDAVEELEELVAHADQVVGITRAEPSRYSLATDKRPIAAYICQHTDYA